MQSLRIITPANEPSLHAPGRTPRLRPPAQHRTKTKPRASDDIYPPEFNINVPKIQYNSLFF